MGMIRIGLMVLVLGALSTSCTDSTGSVFRYRTGFNEGQIQIKIPEPGETLIFLTHDSYVRAKGCAAPSEYVCLVSPSFAFVVPIDLKSSQNTWTHEGVSYQVVERIESLSILGREFKDTVWIRAPSSATEFTRLRGEDGYFLYARAGGLLAMGFWKEGETSGEIYWLREEKGFGAQE